MLSLFFWALKFPSICIVYFVRHRLDSYLSQYLLVLSLMISLFFLPHTWWLPFISFIFRCRISPSLVSPAVASVAFFPFHDCSFSYWYSPISLLAFMHNVSSIHRLLSLRSLQYPSPKNLPGTVTTWRYPFQVPYHHTEQPNTRTKTHRWTGMQYFKGLLSLNGHIYKEITPNKSSWRIYCVGRCLEILPLFICSWTTSRYLFSVFALFAISPSIFTSI